MTGVKNTNRVSEPNKSIIRFIIIRYTLDYN